MRRRKSEDDEWAGVFTASTPKDNFIDFDGLPVGDDATARRWARAIEDRHVKLEVRPMGSVGNDVYPYGIWAIERWVSKDSKGGYQRIRYADNVQLQEIYEALGDADRFHHLLSGDDLPGPFRQGKPPLNAHGKPLVDDEPDMGDHGPLPAECEWIEANDDVFVRYAGSDEKLWPTGCWVVESADADPQLLNAAQVKHVAHEVFGMPHGEVPHVKRKRPAPRVPDDIFEDGEAALGDDLFADVFEGTGPTSYADDNPLYHHYGLELEDIFA